MPGDLLSLTPLKGFLQDRPAFADSLNRLLRDRAAFVSIPVTEILQPFGHVALQVLILLYRCGVETNERGQQQEYAAKQDFSRNRSIHPVHSCRRESRLYSRPLDLNIQTSSATRRRRLDRNSLLRLVFGNSAATSRLPPLPHGNRRTPGEPGCLRRTECQSAPHDRPAARRCAAAKTSRFFSGSRRPSDLE